MRNDPTLYSNDLLLRVDYFGLAPVRFSSASIRSARYLAYV